MSTTTRPTYAQPALIGGAVMGVLSALPIVSAGNICCCLWVVLGGGVAAYVLQQNQSAPITPGDGALVGLLAGLAGAFIQVVVAIPVGIMVAPLERAMLQRIVDLAGTMPPDMREAVDRFGRADAGLGAVFIVLRHVVTLMVWLVLGAVFSTIGGLLGAALFRKQTPAVDVVSHP